MASSKKTSQRAESSQLPTPLRIATSWLDLPLWQHQKDALRSIQRYLAAREKGQTSGSALIRIPTGGGKTGVIAGVAQSFAEIGSSLVVVPWRHLTRQSANEIGDRFWTKLGWTTRRQLKPVIVLRPSIAAEELKREGDAVYLCTFQTLALLHSDAALRASYRRLKRRSAIVLVDEGHREPALRWSEAVRGLEQPTVLFSATPYRNDVRLFDIDRNFTFSFAFDDAVSQRFIRSINVHQETFRDNAGGFVDALLSYYEQLKKSELAGVDNPRVIVRCATSASIRHVASLLRRKGLATVAVHERFDESEESEEAEERALKRQVPDPAENPAVFWIHQNKLIEGLDDPTFRVVAVYEPFGNARAFVQQVGRIIRNPKRLPDQRAFVFAHQKLHLAGLWDRFINYERKVGVRDIGSESIVHDLFILHDDIQYLFGDFRERFEPTATDSHLQLQFVKAANVFRSSGSFSLRQLANSIEDEIDRHGYQVVSGSEPDRSTVVRVYARLEPSPVLRDRAFIELSLGYTIARRQNEVLFYYDSSGLMPPSLWSDGERVGPENLEQLLTGNDASISAVSLLNTDLGTYSVRRRTLGARSIGDIAPGLSDHAFFCSTASGSIRIDPATRARRYVGFSRSRIREQSGQRVSYTGWCDWIESVERELNARRRRGANLFDRFALYSRAPNDPKPLHILFDIEDVVDEYGILGSGSKVLPLEMDDRCWDVENGKFRVRINNVDCAATIQWNRKTKRFLIESEDLDQLVVHHDSTEERKDTLTAYLNANQAFRLVLNDGSVYAHRLFYRARVPLWGREADDPIALRNLLAPKPELAQITSEKGPPGSANATGWARGSLFEYIDRNGPGLLAEERLNPDLMICDDLDAERADFIALQEDPPRIVLIHAKTAESPAPLSASAFHVICSQAVKNLSMLNPSSDEGLARIAQWARPWVAPPGTVNNRVRRGARQSPEEMWRRIRLLVRHPSTSREVWIVMSQGLSLQSFDDARVKRPLPPAHAIQLFYLLQSTWASVSSVGARLKVFCSP